MVLYYLTLFFFIIFAVSYIQDRRKIINGFLLNLFLFSACMLLAFQAFETQNPILMTIFIILVAIFSFFALFGAVLLMGFSFWNARTVIKKEGRNFSNLLTLFLGFGILFMIILSFFDLNALFPSYVVSIINFIYLVIFYFFFIFVNFLVASLVYQLYRPRLNKHFVIVLGSGLIDGHIVPPLLANRIKKALAFYDRQAAKTSPPKIIFSGGRGDDEKLAESVAMRIYAIEHGLPADDALIEDRSVNTLQNMLYSKEIMDTRMKGQKYKVIFSTNNFHLFRAGIYAKKAGLNAQGIGAKTAFYFWPNAMIREFIAIIVMHKKFHLLLIGSMALVGILLQLALWYSNTH